MPLASSLPFELLGRCFDEYNDAYALLCGPGHVSSIWRATSFAHPVFSRFIHLSSPVDRLALEVFTAQMASGRSKGSDIELYLVIYGNVIAQILQLLRSDMHRCVTLDTRYVAAPDELQLWIGALCDLAVPRLRRYGCISLSTAMWRRS